MAERRRFASQAEYYRHHRQVFLLAQELGCTPNQAEAEMRRIQQRERQRAAEQRRQPAINGKTGTVIIDEAASFQRWDAQWMARD